MRSATKTKAMAKSSTGFTAIELFFWLAISAFIVGSFIYKYVLEVQKSVPDRGIQVEKQAEDMVDKLQVQDRTRQNYLDQ